MSANLPGIIVSCSTHLIILYTLSHIQHAAVQEAADQEVEVRLLAAACSQACYVTLRAMRSPACFVPGRRSYCTTSLSPAALVALHPVLSLLPHDMMCCSNVVTQLLCPLQPLDPTFDQAKQVMGWALVAYFLCWTLSPFFLPKARRRHHTVVLLSRFLKVLVGEPHLPGVMLYEPRSDTALAKIWHLHMHSCQLHVACPWGTAL